MYRCTTPNPFAVKEVNRTIQKNLDPNKAPGPLPYHGIPYQETTKCVHC